MPKQRNSTQSARKFLSKAFRHDTLECQRSSAQLRQQQGTTLSNQQAGAASFMPPSFPGATNSAPPPAVARLFQFEWRGLSAPSASSTQQPRSGHHGDITAVQLTMFDNTTRQFFGATYRIEADALPLLTPAEATAQLFAAPSGGSNNAPVLGNTAAPTMMWSCADTVVMCVEALAQGQNANAPHHLTSRSSQQSGERPNSGECVVGWWYCTLSSITTVTEVDLVPGSAALMYLPKATWPPVPRDPSGAPIARATKLYFRATEMSGNGLPLISSYLPSGVFAPTKDVLRGPAYQAPPAAPSSTGGGGNTSGKFRCGIASFRVDLISDEISRLLQPIPQIGATTSMTARTDDAAAAASNSWAAELASLFNSPSALPTIAGASSAAVDSGVAWDVVCCPHSGFRPTSASGVQFPLQQTSSLRLQSLDHNQQQQPQDVTNMTTAAAISLAELADLPNVSMMHLVFALRYRRAGDAAHRIIGYAVVPLSADEDADVTYDQCPVLRGPFTTEDARMSSLEKSSPYASLPIRISVMVKYFSTPVPAKRMEELIENRAHRPEPHLVPALGAQPLPVVAATTSGKQEGPSATPTTLAPSAPSAAPPALDATQTPSEVGTVVGPVLTSGTTPADPQQQQPQPVREVVYVQVQQPQQQSAVPLIAQPAAPQPDLAAHKMLCKILEELDQLRTQNERLTSRLTSSSLALGPRRGSVAAVGEGHTSPGPAGTASTSLGAAASAFEVVDMMPRRCGVSLATRSLLLEGAQTIVHPAHGTPISDGMLSEGSLPHTMVGMRLEGLTIDLDRRNTKLSSSSNTTDTASAAAPAAAVPQRLVGFMSFGNLPMQVLAVMHLQLVVQDGDFQSYKISSSHGGGGGGGGLKGGYVWHEPPFTHQDNLMLQFKAQGNLHLHFYDAVTMFYQFSSTFSLGMFARPLEAAASLTPLDVSLLMDYSLTEKTVPAGVLPVVYNVGQLHVTLFAVGTTASVSKQTPDNIRVLNGGAPAPDGGHHLVSGSNVVIAKKLANGLLDADRVASSFQNGPLASSAAVNQQSLDPRNRLHQARADYVKNLLSRNGGAIPGIPQQHHQELRREGVEMEYRLRFVEKRRDESKAEKIAQVLKQRVTTLHAVTVAGGRTEVYHITFVNPLPTTSLFAISVDDPVSKRHLRIGSAASLTHLTSSSSPQQPLTSDQKRDAIHHGVGSATFILGPHETVKIPLLIRCGTDDASLPTSSSSMQYLEAVIRGADRGETMMIADLHVTFVKPTIDRRFEIFGAPGAEVKKRLFLRLFSAGSLPVEGLGTAAAAEKISNMCTYCTVSDATTTAESKAVIDPITQTHVVAWEEITVQTMIPTNGAKLVFMNIYRDAAMTKHFETWELTVFPCQVVHASSIMFGRTTSIALPVVTSERVYVNDPCVVAVVPPAGAHEATKLRFKPREVGVSQTLLHVQREGKHLDKVLLVTQVAYPTPTYQYAIELSAAEAQVPLQRRFLFVNRESTQRVLTVTTNYRHQVRVSPRVFALGPGDSQHLSLEVVGLSLVDGGLTEGQWPIWIFINDEEDGTVESYHLNVAVRLHRPFF